MAVIKLRKGFSIGDLNPKIGDLLLIGWTSDRSFKDGLFSGTRYLTWQIQGSIFDITLIQKD